MSKGLGSEYGRRAQSSTTREPLARQRGRFVCAELEGSGGGSVVIGVDGINSS